MTAAKKNIEELTHSSKLIFFNVVFPTPVAQGMLWTFLSNTHCTQMMSAHLTQMQARVRVFLSFPVQLRLPFPGKAGKSCYPVWWNLIISCECSSQSWYVWPQKYQNMRGFSGTLLGESNPTRFFSPGDIIPLGGGVKPAAPVAEWKELLFSSARRFSHSSWGAESPRSLLGIIQSRIYMQPRLMSHVRLPFKKSQSGPHPAQIRGIKAFNRQSVNSLKNIPSCLYKRLVRNLQTS